MLTPEIIGRNLDGGPKIRADRSRCLRMRFNRNRCTRCTAHCRPGAIAIADNIRLFSHRCSGCMLCVSGCPADVFETPGFDFCSLVEKLRKQPSSLPSHVLGCGKDRGADGHVRSVCFGFLSEEHLIALAVLLEGTLQLDVSGCADCHNGFVLEILRGRMAEATRKSAVGISDKIRLVDRKPDPGFQEVRYSRRGFFRAIRSGTWNQAAELAGFLQNDHSGESVRSYSNKQTPFKRELLGRVLKELPEEPSRSLLENYYYSLHIDEGCDHCFSCTAMCPSGALQSGDSGDGQRLLFCSALCNACGLCEGFCRRKSIRIEKGFPGVNPFQFILIQR